MLLNTIFNFYVSLKFTKKELAYFRQREHICNSCDETSPVYDMGYSCGRFEHLDPIEESYEERYIIYSELKDYFRKIL